MINLIPKEEKIHIIDEYRRRLLAIFLLLLLCTSTSALFLLLPTYVLLEAKHKTVLESLEIAKRISLERKDIETETVVRNLNDRIRVVLSSLEKRSVVDIVSVVVSKKIEGIHIQKISYDEKQNDGIVLVSGVASNRERALSFVKELESSQIFSKVDLPVGSLVKEKDLGFLISATLKNI